MIDGAKIRRLRTYAGMTLKDLGEAVGVAEQQIHYYEKELKNPSVITLKRLADELGVSVNDLYKNHDGDTLTQPEKRA